MEVQKADVEVVVIGPKDEDDEALSDRPNMRSGSLSDNSTPYITDSDGDDFFDAKEEREEEGSRRSKEKAPRKSSMIKLTLELKSQIVSQTEFLFSDENLEKDGFLLKHVKRNKEGFVNLKLLSSFKKMRSICKDYRVICEALKDSKLLVMNDECTKIRRKDPLPEKLFDQPPVRFIVVSNMKNENPSMDFISELFHDSGEIAGLRIVRPGKKYPADLQSHFAHNPDLVNETVAVVEFEAADMALDVIRSGKDGLPEKYKDIDLNPLHLGVKQLARRSRQLSGGSENRSGSEDVTSSKEEENNQLRVGKTRKQEKRKVNKKSNQPFRDESCASSSDNDGNFSSFSSYRRRYDGGSRSQGSSPRSSPKLPARQSESKIAAGSPHSSPNLQKRQVDKNLTKKGNSTYKYQRELKVSPLAKEISPATSPEIPRKPFQRRMVVESSSLPNSPWITRRKLYNKDHNENVETLNGKLNAFGLIRQPRGPDGTKGFIFNASRIAIHA